MKETFNLMYLGLFPLGKSSSGKGMGIKMINSELKETIVQNLKDAGCVPQMIEDFMLYYDKNQKEKQLELLAAQRKDLLNRVHIEEKKISCLDYLIYQIEK